MKLEKDQEPNANKHFLLYKLCLQTKNPKIIEICLYYLQVKFPLFYLTFYKKKKLISNNFFDGNCPDHTYNINLDEAPSTQIVSPEPYFYHRRLIDSVVESITSCMNEKDENIQLLVISILLTMLTNPKIEVHDKSLITAFRTFIHIFSCKYLYFK